MAEPASSDEKRATVLRQNLSNGIKIYFSKNIEIDVLENASVGRQASSSNNYFKAKYKKNDKYSAFVTTKK